MEYRTLIGTDLKWSRIGLGCWAMGGKYWGDDVVEADSVAAIHAAVEAGINWVDTAPLYGEGFSDSLVARELKGKDVSIATKIGVRWDGEHARSDLHPNHLRNDLEAILKRLKREQIDLLQVHWPCQENTPLEESFGTLGQFVQAGKVRYLGVCNYDAVRLKTIRRITPIVSLQTPYSMLRREFEAQLQPTCSELGLSSLAYEPLCRGLLTGKFTHRPTFPDSDLRARDERFSGPGFSHAQRIVADLKRVGQKVNLTPAALALGWALQRCDFVIAGAKRPEQVLENATGTTALTQKTLWAVVDKILGIHGGIPRF